MNTQHRKTLPGTALNWFDAREAVESIRPGAWAGLSYTARVHAENLVRRADPAQLRDFLLQLITLVFQLTQFIAADADVEGLWRAGHLCCGHCLPRK